MPTAYCRKRSLVNGKSTISTGVGFFDHMLEGFSKHGFFDLELKVDGDLQVDAHHTVEDTGIVLGQAIADAIGDKKGIKRYGSFILPMDDALVLCATTSTFLKFKIVVLIINKIFKHKSLTYNLKLFFLYLDHCIQYIVLHIHNMFHFHIYNYLFSHIRLFD